MPKPVIAGTDNTHKSLAVNWVLCFAFLHYWFQNPCSDLSISFIAVIS
jgi:hypothetical protein